MRYFLIILGMLLAASVSAQDSLSATRDSLGVWKADSLGTVVVTGSSMSQHGDVTRVFITKNLRRGTVSAAQMMGKLPNFFYNFADRSLKYNNSDNIVVLVDSVEKDMDYLRNIQHLRFDRVEIIDRPGGKYQGYDVLVNLHTKPDYEGYEGALSNNEAANVNHANSRRLIFENTSGYLSYTRNRWNVYGFASSYFGQASTDSYHSTHYLLNGLTDEVVANPDGGKNWTSFERIVGGKLSVDYTIDRHQSLSFVYLYNAGRDYDGYYRQTVNRTYDGDGSVRQFSRGIDTHSRNCEHSMAVFYRNDVGRVKWSTDLNYRFIPSSSRSHQVESTGFQLSNRFRDRMNFTRFRLSGWTNAMGGHLTLSAGYVNTWKDYLRRGYDSGERLNSNSYLRNQLWASARYRFDNNAQLMLSGWAEHIALKNGTSRETQVPCGGSLMAYYQLSRKNWARLNYSCSTEYPSQGLSSEYGYFTDSLCWSGGNPWLRTNVTHRINLWVDLWWCFNFQAGYVISPNAFNSICEVREGTLPSGAHGYYAAYVYQNTRYEEYWASVSFTKRFLRNFVYKADLKLQHARASYSVFSNSANAVQASTSLQYYSPGLDMNASLSYIYRRDLGLTPQSTQKSNYEEPALNVQKYLCGKRLEVGLSYSLFFHLFDADIVSETRSPAVETRAVDRYFERQRNRFTLYVSYRFSGGKSVRKYNKEMSSEL